MVRLRAGLQKTSLVNYPGRIAAAVFLPGCNLRCPYCYNKELAEADAAAGPGENAVQEYFSLEEITAHLEKRAGVLGAVAVSGGEPLLSPALEPLILKAKELGLAVKIDTNGTLPDKLEALINREEIRPDMIAMDIKTKPRNYYLLCPGYSGCIPDTDATAGKIERSISILAKAAAEKLIEVEYRTVLVPGLTEEEDIEAISLLLPHDAEWKFAAFSPGGCINPEWDNIQPFSREKTDKLLEIARRNVPAASLR